MPIDTSEWYAWVDLTLPGTRSLNVQGVVTLPTPGYEVRLTPAAPGAASPRELLLDFRITALAGNWIQVITRRSISYRIGRYTGDLDRVRVRLPDGTLIPLKIVEVR